MLARPHAARQDSGWRLRRHGRRGEPACFRTMGRQAEGDPLRKLSPRSAGAEGDPLRKLADSQGKQRGPGDGGEAPSTLPEA